MPQALTTIHPAVVAAVIVGVFGLRIAVIVFGAYVTVRAINLWIQYFEYHLTSDAVGPNGQERRRRARAVDSR